MIRSTILIAALLTLPICEGQDASPLIEKIDAPHLPNAYRLHTKVISGGLPEGHAAFEELKKLGVRTIISVDGAKPDVELAAKYGMRYVHLPHGYDGIAKGRGEELAKAVHDLPGPIYIHCHHGKHRSPAAATVACVAVGYIDASQANRILKTAGTNPHYRGLYQAAEEARPIDKAVLDALNVEFKSVAPITPLAEEMVEIEHLHDQLKKLSASRWEFAGSKSREDAAHVALLLRERFTELLRLKDTGYDAAAYRVLLQSSERDAAAIETALRETTTPSESHAETAFVRLNQSCISCHQQFRDVPLSEKK